MSELNVVVIGASAGGIQSLMRLVDALPPDLNACIMIVVHIPPNAHSVLPQILNRSQRLAASHPIDKQRIQPGRIYVAPPDSHMLLTAEARLILTKGPKENGCRPAIDPLFRSAALHYGPKVIAVVASGMLADGSAGILAVKNAGGTTIVQDPRDAAFGGMPQHAIETVKPDYVLSAPCIGTLIGSLCAEADVVKSELHRQSC